METNILTSVILPLSLVIIMLGMGTTLVLADFKRVLIYPKAVAIGIVGQILILPVVGFLFASQFGLKPEYAVGVMVLVACAGGATSNMIVYLAKGDVALSVTLTAISSCITVISIPFIINFALHEFMGASDDAVLPIGTTNMKLFAFTLLPVMVGMWLRHKFTALAIKLEKPMNRFASVLFVLIVCSIMFQERAGLVDTMLTAGPVAYGLNFITMVLGFSAARAFRLNDRQSIAISIEVGVQNSATGIIIATTMLHNAEIAIIPAVYSLIMYLNAGLLIGLMQVVMKRRATTVAKAI